MDMKRIIRIQWMQLQRNRWFYLVFVCFSLMAVLLSKIVCNPDMQDCSGGVVAVLSASFMDYIVVLYVMVNTAVLAAQDYEDGTMYLMLTAGYARAVVYLVKVIFVMAVNGIMSILLMLMPVVFHIAMYGWGDAIRPDGYMLRLLLIGCFMGRISALTLMLFFIVKKRFLTIGGGMAIVVAENWMTTNYEIRSENVLFLTTFQKIADYTWKAESHFTSGYITFQIKDSIDAARQGNIFLVSLGIVFACLMAGYGYFRWDDMK